MRFNGIIIYPHQDFFTVQTGIYQLFVINIQLNVQNYVRKIAC